MVTDTYIQMQREKRAAELARQVKQERIMGQIERGTIQPLHSFQGGVEALAAARDCAALHLLMGEDGWDIIEAVVTHSAGRTRYALRADAWETAYERLTARTSIQNGLLTKTPHTPIRRGNATPRTRFA